ncbi:MAG: putative metal-binding motif-containing protein, partial [Patescibacteria group bacterium]|nr:putative metal-binding motif-containing protein [Patescibacteria group bacterium]
MKKNQKILIFLIGIGLFWSSLALAIAPVVQEIYTESFTVNEEEQIWVKIYDADGNFDLGEAYYCVDSNGLKVIDEKAISCWDFAPYYYCFYSTVPDCSWGEEAYIFVVALDKAGEWSDEKLKTVPVITPSEICDGKDNDCDGEI